MVKLTLVEFQSLWPCGGRQRRMAETLDQKRERLSSLPLSPTLLAGPLSGGIGTNGSASCTLHLVFAENAGCPTQGDTCTGTEASYDST